MGFSIITFSQIYCRHTDGSSPSCWETPSLIFRVRASGVKLARGPKPEAQRADSGVGFFGMGNLASSPPARKAQLPQPGPAAKRFSYILEAPGGFSRNLLGQLWGRHGAWPPCPFPLKSTHDDNSMSVKTRQLRAGPSIIEHPPPSW